MASVQDRVIGVTARVLRIDPAQISLGHAFTTDLGAESVQSVELVAMFEEEFGIEMDEEAAIEAILAAVYLDGGLEAARAFFDKAWAEEFSAPPSRTVTNPKSALQEWAQAKGRPLPTYRVADRTGSDHAPTFTIEVSVEGVEPLTAQGRSRQEAEKAAATALLKREGVIRPISKTSARASPPSSARRTPASPRWSTG